MQPTLAPAPPHQIGSSAQVSIPIPCNGLICARNPARASLYDLSAILGHAIVLSIEEMLTLTRIRILQLTTMVSLPSSLCFIINSPFLFLAYSLKLTHCLLCARADIRTHLALAISPHQTQGYVDGIPPNSVSQSDSSSSQLHHGLVGNSGGGSGQDMMSGSAGDSGDDDGRKGSKRELSQSKRAAQNRAAQVSHSSLCSPSSSSSIVKCHSSCLSIAYVALSFRSHKIVLDINFEGCGGLRVR